MDDNEIIFRLFCQIIRGQRAVISPCREELRVEH